MAIQPHSRIESQLTDPTYNGPYLSRIELILKDMLENYGRIAFVGPYDSLEDLPETGQAGYVYLVRVEGSNLCDEYIWDEQDEEYNYVGRFEIDLDAYATETEVQEIRLSISNLSASVLLKQNKTLTNPVTIKEVVYTTVESALAALAGMSGAEFVQVLPTASASTMDTLYVLEVSGEDPELYVTTVSNNVYSWFKLSGSDVEEITVSEAHDDFEAVFGSGTAGNPNLVTVSPTVFDSSDVTIVDP